MAFALVLALLAAAPAAEAQSSGKTPRIGLLFLSSTASASAPLELLRAALRELGYVEGRSIVIEYRSAEGRAERLPALAADLVERKVDLIVTGGGNPATLAARKVTTTIPIVMGGTADAVEAGLVQSLARPGGNITGLSVPQELVSKQLELLRELVPSLSRVVVFLRRNPAAAARRAQAKALTLEFYRTTLEYVEVEKPEDLAPAFATARAARPHAMLLAPDPLFWSERDQILDFARAARLPAMYPFPDFLEAGGLVSYSVNALEVTRAIARYVDRILKGAKPADLPVEQPTTFELVINGKTARALGVAISPSLRLRADKVID
jgi:putative ABC transport system substrate-binding protein